MEILAVTMEDIGAESAPVERCGADERQAYEVPVMTWRCQ